VSTVNEATRASVATRLAGLPAGKAVEVMLYKNGQPVYVDAEGSPRPQTLTADATGEIRNAVLFYDLGIDPRTGFEVDAVGTYTVHITGQGIDLLKELTVSRSARGRQGSVPTIWVMRSGGGGSRFAVGSVLRGEPVQVKGVGFQPNATVHLFVVADKREWAAADPLSDVTTTVEEVTTNAEGEISPPVQVWASASAVNGNRDFDLVADVDKDGKYSAGDAIDAGRLTGFTVQEAPRGSTTEGVQLACDGSGTYKDSFAANPPSRPLAPSQLVKKYILVHRDSWRLGEALVDVTGRPEWDLVRYACSNQYIAPVWSAPLIPGKYDVVIDVNQNDVYDAGDILDGGGAGAGFQVQGPVPKRVLVSANPPIVNPNQASVLKAQVIDEKDAPIPNSTVSFTAGQGATLSAASATTNAQGVASVTLTAGATGGVSVSVTAMVNIEQTAVTGTTTVDVRALGSISALIQ